MFLTLKFYTEEYIPQKFVHTVWRETVVGGNCGEFGKRPWIFQILPSKFYASNKS